MSEDLLLKVALALAMRGRPEALEGLSVAQLARLNTEDLLAIQRNGTPAKPRSKSGTHAPLRAGSTGSHAAHRVQPELTVRAAVLQACALRALTTREMIEAVEALRPFDGDPDDVGAVRGYHATIRTEAKRLKDRGELEHTGPHIGGKYRTKR